MENSTQTDADMDHQSFASKPDVFATGDSKRGNAFVAAHVINKLCRKISDLQK